MLRSIRAYYLLSAVLTFGAGLLFVTLFAPGNARQPSSSSIPQRSVSKVCVDASEMRDVRSYLEERIRETRCAIEDSKRTSPRGSNTERDVREMLDRLESQLEMLLEERDRLGEAPSDELLSSDSDRTTKLVYNQVCFETQWTNP